VHRDVKPENIMLTGGRAVVADFGIARAVTAAAGERLTGTGLAIGTPVYMSPEQAMGLEDVDARSDVYSLGCVVYEMVGGRAPFEGTPPQALLAKHAADTVPSLRTSDPQIPVFVERAVEKALAKDPAERFQTPSTFAEALTSGTVVARVGRRRWRRRTVVGAATAVVLLGWAGGVGVGAPWSVRQRPSCCFWPREAGGWQPWLAARPSSGWRSSRWTISPTTPTRSTSSRACTRA